MSMFSAKRLVSLGLFLAVTSCKVYENPASKTATNTNIDAVIACTRDGEVRETNPRFFSVDRCQGSYTIQGISYRCGKVGDVTSRTSEFLSLLNERAQKRCESLCRDRGRDCVGSYRAASRCGFSVPMNRASEVGEKIVGCHPNCEGTAFAYCSLYHGSYFRIEDHLFENDQPNCYCQRKR